MIHKRILPLAMLVLASCSTQPASPPPAPTASPSPPSAPPPVAIAEPDDWMDAPATPGEWTYAPGNGTTAATFTDQTGTRLFSIECNPENLVITLFRPAQTTGRVPVKVLTESIDRMLDAISVSYGTPGLAAQLPARDPLLDAMAISKGRFAVETAGLPTLYLPSWAEVSRVIEDCR